MDVLNQNDDNKATNINPQHDAVALNGAECLCHWLVQHGIDTVFTIPGAQILPLIHTINRCSDLRVITASHEAGAAYMADGLARRSGKPTVCISVGSPGASNMLTAAATAFQDDSPVLFITGNVDVSQTGQGAFQDAGPNGSDDAALFHIAIKHSFTLNRRAAMIETLDNAWHVLQLGQPAHLILPLNVQTASCAEPVQLSDYIAADSAHHNTSYIQELSTLLLQARMPLILAGHRVLSSRLRQQVRIFCEHWNIPLVTTLAAKSLLSEDHPLCFGNAGFAGQPKANTLLMNPAVDLLLVIGADFNERDSLGWHPEINSSTRNVICIDSKKLTALNPDLVDTCYAPVDLSAYLQALCDLAPSISPLRNITRYTTNSPELSFSNNAGTKVAVTELIRLLQLNLSAETTCFVDSGSIRVFAGQLWQAKTECCFFTASSSAPMGWALSAAIGAGFLRHETPSLVLTGDGSMLMHGTELAVAARYNIPLIIILLDNGGQSASLRCVTTDEKHRGPYLSPEVDWIAFAHSLGARGQTIHDLNELGNVLNELADLDGPYVLHFHTDPLENYPFPEYVCISDTRITD